jgi:hypothetical protein
LLLLLFAAAICPSVRPPVLSAQTTDSLIACAQRTARAWRAHDYAGLLEGSRAVSVHLPGADPSAPLRPSQATELLRTFVGAAREIQVEVEVARDVDSARAYVEIRRTFVTRLGAEPRAETLYVGMRRAGRGYAVSEIRVVR